MVQKEVAERLQGSPETGSFGSLSLFCQFYLNVEVLAKVSRNCFTPVPSVDSAVIRLTPLKKPRVAVRSEELLFKLIKAAFWGKRKMLRKCLRHSPYVQYSSLETAAVEKETGIKLDRRGETLTLEEYAKLTNVLFAISGPR